MPYCKRSYVCLLSGETSVVYSAATVTSSAVFKAPQHLQSRVAACEWTEKISENFNESSTQVIFSL